MEVSLVTSNAGKFEEVRNLLRPFGLTVQWRKETLPEPQADDLKTVVRAKLDGTRSRAEFVLVEDSGLFIPSLGGFPGVYSSYIYRTWRFAPILELLQRRDRSAVFRTVAGLRRGSRRWLFTGECRGAISRRPRGTGGFGFDPIFLPNGGSKTYAELSPEEKNGCSHRSRAMRKVGRFLHRLQGHKPAKSR